MNGGTNGQGGGNYLPNGPGTMDGAEGIGAAGIGAAGIGGGTYVATPPMFSLNNRFIVEPYASDRTIKTAASTGATSFARIEQKVAVKGLRLLVAVKLEIANQVVMVNAGSTIYIREELLHTQPWAKNIMENERIGKFMIVDKSFVEFVQPV